MKTFAIGAALAVAASAFKITFQNDCSYAVWAAIVKARSCPGDPFLPYGVALEPGASQSYETDDHTRGIRAWGTDYKPGGANCACNGGLVCNDASIFSHLSEIGTCDRGLPTGNLTYWYLTQMGTVNIPTTLTSSDGQSVKCTPSSCPADQVFKFEGIEGWKPNVFAARKSALGVTYTHKFC